jgi:hypothetical protein
MNVLSLKNEAAGNACHDASGARRWLAERISRSRKVGMFTEVVLATPALARVLLAEHNTRNRNLRNKRADEFARIIKTGQWMLTSQGISIATDGKINNGQHRLLGIDRADQAVPLAVTFGESVEAFVVLDTQGVRGSRDVLHIDGEQNSAALAAAARLLRMVLENTHMKNPHYTNQEIREVVAEHGGLREAAVAGGRFSKAFRGTSTGGATLAYYLIESRSKRAMQLSDFWGKACTGTGLNAQRDPILILRNYFIKRPAGLPRVNIGVFVAASIITSWNLWAQGKKTVSVTWDGKSDFPQVI